MGNEHFTGRTGSDYNDKLVKQQWGKSFYLGRTDNAQYVHILDRTLYKLLPRAHLANATKVVQLLHEINSFNHTSTW